jgi:hypothetical protein
MWPIPHSIFVKWYNEASSVHCQIQYHYGIFLNTWDLTMLSSATTFY